MRSEGSNARFWARGRATGIPSQRTAAHSPESKFAPNKKKLKRLVMGKKKRKE